ncbi:hypothetical protein [Candidatus Chlorohelix sp.]|uniref:hypothetical protein n=1 Tax=Candidatus Chlorohelix sp. TaxID=3139201 RepID=UPI00306E694F
MTQKIYEPHHPTRNSGFVIIAVFSLFILLSVAFLVLSTMNPGWSVWLIVELVMVALWLLILKLLANALKNEPRRVILDEAKLWVETEDGKRELEIPFDKITAVNEGKAFIVNTDDPQLEKFKTWYRGLVIDWREGETEVRSVLDERNTREFDELMDEVFARSPEGTQGERFYER